LETVARETPKLIGGAGLTVEIDDCKFGQGKYNKVEWQWVIEGICRKTKDISCGVSRQQMQHCHTPRHHQATRQQGLNHHRHCWHAYDQLDSDGWQHLTVNHQYNFVGKNLEVVSHKSLVIIVKYT